MNRERIVEGIFNYCTRRCERCRFTAQCTLYQSEREYERRHPEAGALECVGDSFAETWRLLEAWCVREGIDFEEVRREAENDASRAELNRVDEAVRSDPLQRRASAYAHAAFTVVDAMASARALRKWPPEVEEALDTVSWNAGLVGAKVHRALHGSAERDMVRDEDPVQNDWNGSAKVARIVIEESKRAWQLILREGEATDDSPLLELVALLDRIDREMGERFPHAMDFVRPGFDRPAVTRVLPERAR